MKLGHLLAFLFESPNLLNLLSLSLMQNDLSAPAVFESLKMAITHSNLREINLAHNNLGNKGVKSIA